MAENRDFRAAEMIGVVFGMLAVSYWGGSDPSFLFRGAGALAGGLLGGWLGRYMGSRGWAISNLMAGAVIVGLSIVGVAAAYVIGDLAWHDEIPVMLGILGFWLFAGSALLFLLLSRGEAQGPRFRVISVGLLLGGFLSQI